MQPSTAAAAACDASALVVVTGPDSDGSVAASSAFHTAPSFGRTALSTSGVLLPFAFGEPRLVVAPAACFEAFSSSSQSSALNLRAGVSVSVLLGPGPSSEWFAASIVQTVDLTSSPLLAAALAPFAGAWDVSSTRLALLQLQAPPSHRAPDAALWGGGEKLFRGGMLCLASAPFGALSPSSFRASASSACVSALLPPPPDSPDGAQTACVPPLLLLLDGRCLPGSEGAAVACAATGRLVGVALLPLRGRFAARPSSTSSDRPSPPPRPAACACPDADDGPWLAITAAGLAAALAPGGATQRDETRSLVALLSRLRISPAEAAAAPPALEDAASRVALLRVGSSWASAVPLGATGFFVTAAHTVHPGRTGKPGALGFGSRAKEKNWIINALPPLPSGAARSAELRFAPHGRWWRAEVMWVCTGPLDVALLRVLVPPPSLDSGAVYDALPLPLPLSHIDTPAGSPVWVAGHGRFPPDMRMPTALTSGVISSSSGGAFAPLSHHLHEHSHAAASHPMSRADSLGQPQPQLQPQPALLRTTCVVRPGASGGAVLTRSGAVAAVVSSNAKLDGGGWGRRGAPHKKEGGGGRSAPHSPSQHLFFPSLNFCVPAARLARLVAAVAAVAADEAAVAAAAGGSVVGAAPSGSGGAALAVACEELDGRDDAAAMAWALKPPPPQPQPPHGLRSRL